MKVTVQKVHEYRPAWGGNLDLPASEQIVVMLRTPTVAERQRYCGIDLSATMNGSEHTPRIDIRTDHISLVRRHVESVRNLVLEIDGLDSDIRNADEMVNAIGLHDLVTEIGTEISGLAAEVTGLDPRSATRSARGSGAISAAEKLPAGD